jgi:hypothetical protein
MNSPIYYVKTLVGRFRVKKTDTHLRVGGKRFCVEIRFGNPAELQWLITKDGGCELDDKPIQGSATIHLLNLSFTLLKLYNDVKYITFLDNSKFDCLLDNGSSVTIFMNKYYYLFHGGTWYDINTGAVPIDETQRLLYNETKPLYTDPSIKKPFDFKNPSLQKELGPIYEEATTWKEFADSLHEKYDRDTLCRKIAPWYLSAVAELTKNRMLPEYWIIDVSSAPTIPFTQIPTFQSAGTRRKTKYFHKKDTYKILSPSELYDS